VLCFLTSMDHRRALMVFVFPVPPHAWRTQI
jgi:hypothetical protein